MESNRRTGPLITAQTGWDEAYLVGTEEELLEFAQAIVESVKASKPEMFLDESGTKVAKFYGEVGSESELQFDWLVVTEDAEQNVRLSRKIEGI